MIRKDIDGVQFDWYEDGSMILGGKVTLTGDGVTQLKTFLTQEKPAPAHHSAKPGEVWDLDSTQGVTYRVVAVFDDDVFDEIPMFIQPSTGTWFSLDDPLFTGGERVL